MADFRRFLPQTTAERKQIGESSASGAGTDIQPTTREERRARYQQRGEFQQNAQTAFGLHASFAIPMDSTGSMGAYIHQARDDMQDIFLRVQKETGGALPEIQLWGYRDYCDGEQHILQISDKSTDFQYLASWLNALVPTGGGDTREAVEFALQRILTTGGFAATILIGDAPAHTVDEIRVQSRDPLPIARDLAWDFRQAGMPIHTFVVGQDPETIEDFRLIAANSGGQSGFLDGREAMLNMMVMVMLERMRGTLAVSRYIEKYRPMLTAGALAFGQRLALPPGERKKG